MAINDRRIVELIMQHCQDVEERAGGYRAALIDHLADILSLERRNQVQRISIQQDVTAKCEALGAFLSQQRGGDISSS